MTIVTAVGDAIQSVLDWIGLVITSLTTGGNTPGALNALLPLFAIGIAVSAVLLGIKMIKSVVWGA